MKRMVFALISSLLVGIAAWLVIWPEASRADALQQGRTYSTNADFAEGVLVGVESATVPNQLQLSREGGIPPYIWVPNQNEGSISKVDTRTGREAGRYRTGGGTSSNPSRTTVDLQGNCWVGNRNYASVVEVALAEADCVDRNGNSVIETSRDTNGDGDITGAELLDWGKDECVLREVIVAAGKEGTFTPGAFTNYSAYGDEGTRAMAIDANGNIWAGVYRDRKYFNIASANGAIVRTIDVAPQSHYPYGAAIDRYGTLWSADVATGFVLRINPATGALTKIATNHQVYGLGIDKLDHLFATGWESSKISRINVVNNQVEWTKDLEYRSRGVVVSDDNDIWIANSNSNRVHRWANDGTPKTAINTGSGESSGVAIDQNGKIWVVNRSDATIRRIDPATNTVDLSKTLNGTSGHYGYSDMTGKVARTVTSRTGTWTVVYDAGAASTTWGTLRWNGSEPAGTSIKARVRSSANQQSWSNWEQVTNGAAFNAIPANRYLQIEVTLQLTTGETSPVLYDLTVSPGGGGGGTCTYAVTPTTQAFSVAGGTGTISVATSAECGWTATRSVAWMSVTAGNSGTGSGTVTYTVQANTSPSSRVGGLLVAGHYVLITQAGSLGNCPVTPLTIPQTVNATLSTTDCRSVIDENAYADLYSFSGQAGQRIAIAHTTTAFDAYLVLIAENGSIIGSNDDSDSSTTSSRIPAGSGYYVLPYTGTYIIEASSFNANETGSYVLSLTAASGGPACSYDVAPTLAAFNAVGGDGNVTLTAATGCEWTANSLSSWIRVNSGASSSGNGTVNYTVSGNTSQGFRLGRLVIGGKFVTVVQGGTGGNCPITPVGVPSTTNAAWAVGDCASGAGGFSDLYSFSGQAGQQVSIETVTQTTTTGLYLYGPTGSFVVGYEGNGTQRIPPGTGFYVLPYTGTYLIEANAGTPGNYTLNLNVPSVTPSCPTVSGLTPSSGAVGSTVTITGNNFTGVTAVRFANNVSAQFTVNSNTQITATVPSGAVTGVITLSKTGCADVQTSPFTVTTAGPCIDVVIASNLTAGAGTTLTAPIAASDTTGKSVIAYDATLTYDPAVLRLQNPPTDKTGTLSSNFTITTNIPAAGQLRISGFGSTALTGAGVLLNVKFDVLGAANACSNLSFTSFRFNEGTPCSTTTNGRACVTGGGTLSGAVSYCITPKPVPGVAVNVTGSATTSATTNTSGSYTLPNLNSGNYTLTPAKSGDVNGLASFDAALVAQHVVGINTLNTCQQLAGDTSNNGELSSFDAALIAQYVVGINNAASIAGTWKFVPPTRGYTNLSSNQTNQNFDAVLVGDVSGNWAAGATAFDELARTSSPAQQVSIALPNLNATTGTSVTIPITVGDLSGKGVIAYDFDLVFDQNVLQAQSTPYDAANTLSSTLTITANPQPGRLRVSAFGTQPLTGAGTLLNLKFNVTGAGGTSTALTWQRCLLNETVQTNLTNGRVNVGYAVACVSAASFVGTALAGESIVAGFGQGLAIRTEAAATVPLPTSLAGTTVRVRDSAGIERLAPLFFVSSGQVNYQVPPGTAAGAATLIINSGDGAVSTGTMQIARVMPGLFAANSNGMGVAAALVLRVKADGSQVYELVATYDAAQQRFVPLPLSLGPAGEQLYLILFGTGARNYSGLANVQARVGGTTAEVGYIGPVEGLIGLDQLNVGPLPRSLAGRGEVSIAVQVDGQTANVVTVSVR
ncbi:MAG: hypothetical protein HYR56_08240 [Acidobacteria bacterium]|nr:hypothetical protein [Acidobacteriota bacterium]MBI3425448.1 hypothetical protein [Acidobacteriota bacterium]